MATAPPLLQALEAWQRVFMQRSMSDVMRYARGAGLSMHQFGLLFYLHRTGTSRAVSDVGDGLGVTSAAASQMIDRLVQQGLLERSEDPSDRRMKQIVLAAKGRELIEASMQARQSWMRDLARRLTAAQQKEVIAALKVLTAAAESLELERPVGNGHSVP